MESGEFIVQVMLKPNCGLENTRAALVMRRILPLCDDVSCHPRTVKSDKGTITYLRDHGLFIRFSSSKPEQVLVAIKSAFFVDRCTFVEDAGSIPSYDAATGAADDEQGGQAFALPTTFAGHDERGARDDELLALLARFEETHRALRAHAERAPRNRELSGIVFEHAQAVDGLRTAVSRSRIEPFNRIEPSLRTLVDDYGLRFGVAADLDVAEGNTALDRSVLASIEEALKHVIRSIIRDSIESPDERAAAGKPARAAIRLRLENDGSEVACRIEHDGRLFDLRAIGQQALDRGLLARPLETYTDNEIGAFLLLPGFTPANASHVANGFAPLNEIGSMLQHVGGHGYVRNTAKGTAEIILHFPVPFTVIEVALVRTKDASFALPAQQIKRFEALHPNNIEAQGEADAASLSSAGARTWYTCEDGERYELFNGAGTSSPFAAANPSFVVLLDVFGQRCCLALDAVSGYERVSVNQLPPLIDRQAMQAAGCIGYAVLESGALRPVVSVRRLLNLATKERERHA